uniref:Chlororespiratory reduction protein 7 n=1 Tax=Cyanothece sp. (strain PCC 7425 / ATCC 29141) TaxID=395961 RepID=B8HPT5_CYAP4
MPNSLMYEEDMFVVLETGEPEQFLSAAELMEKLKSILSDRQDNLPRDLQNIVGVDAQAKRLLDTSCDLDMGPDRYLQWYVVRLEK